MKKIQKIIIKRGGHEGGHDGHDVPLFVFYGKC